MLHIFNIQLDKIEPKYKSCFLGNNYTSLIVFIDKKKNKKNTCLFIVYISIRASVNKLIIQKYVGQHFFCWVKCPNSELLLSTNII